MLTSKKLELRRSEIRQQLAELANIENPSEDEVRKMGELDAEYRTKEAQYRSALIAEDEERREAGEELETRSGAEWADLIGGFELRQAVLALDEGAALSGKTAEVVQEMRNAGGYRGIPVPLMALEQRAGETVSSGTPDPMQTRPIIDRLFPSSVAARLGVQTVNIGQGSVEWPVATSGAVAGWAATEGGSVGDATAYATAEKALKPDNTLGAHMRVTRRALKQSGEGLETAIRRDLSAAIGAELDKATLMGTGADGQPLGIIPGAATYGITSTPVGAAATWAEIRDEVIAFINANAASSPADVRLAFGPSVWGDLDAALISGTAVSELDRLSKHVPAANQALATALEPSTAVLTTSAGGIAPAFVGIWGGVDLVKDIYSDAQSGGLRLTGLVTADVTVARGSQVRILTDLAGS
ncbi:phage major capsid protein [Celeribacter halophilus]|uniref:phage major capsid protein n=1 Tax=Celeribacter halophilus TaxID=576117 RepID=UPI0026E4243A|nr:phage major capsid protein [Celeribacter halophilus]MDO6722782.1 phage major capsid protein [Celeribacter halophilus]